MRAILALVTMLGLVAALPAQAATQVQATLSAGTVESGATVNLVVSVTDGQGGTGDPQFTLPRGLAMLGSEQSQNFSWINGRSTSRIEYRYAIGTEQPGKFVIGPIRVRVGKLVYDCPTMALTVTAGASRPVTRPTGVAGASFVVEAKPEHPYVGQLVQLTMRLVQTVSLTQGAANGTPSTTGFWSESYGAPIEYRANAGGRSAYVTERRVRIYPLAPGRATIGSASLLVIPATTNQDPFFGGPSPQPIEIRSESVHVQVQALPAGAPPAFANAVGAFTWSWSLDRGHTTQDQALALRLDVRGSGNLPLLRTPPLALPDFEVYAGTVSDSFAPPGEIAPGRRRFQWTLMPRRTGTLRVPGQPMAWFDPAAAAYRSTVLPVLEVEVLASGPGHAEDEDAGVLPAALARVPALPGSRAAQPWVFALGGLLLGLAVQLWRRSSAPDPHAGDRTMQAALRERIANTRGADFWLVADEAVAFAERQGQQVLRLREDIAAARYGGLMQPEDDVRRRIRERLEDVAPPVRSAAPMRALAVAVAAVAIASWFVGSGGRGPEGYAVRARAADALARQRDVAGAASGWAQLWRESPGDPALAARMAWAELRSSHLPEAATWVLRGRDGERRCGALVWAEARVREGGGLVGSPGAGLPVRSIEWAALAFALALGAALEWPRRWSSVPLLLLAIAAASVPPLSALRARATELAVVRVDTPLVGGGTSLEPGEVVRVLSRRGAVVHVSAGHDVAGDVAAPALLAVREGAR